MKSSLLLAIPADPALQLVERLKAEFPPVHSLDDLYEEPGTNTK